MADRTAEALRARIAAVSAPGPGPRPGPGSGDFARDVQLSSIKSMIGHSIGASGAIEAAALAMSLHTQVYPPTINLTNPDPQCDLDYIPNTAREARVKFGLSTSFGFGGQNGALVMAAV